MDTECSESLSRPLTKANIADTGFVRDLENVLDGVGNVVPSEVIDTIVPEFGRIRIMVDGFLGILVSPIVTQPDIEAKFNQNKGDASPRGIEADPDLRVHEEAMVKVNDGFARGSPPGWTLFAFPQAEAMETEEIPVLCEDVVLLK